MKKISAILALLCVACSTPEPEIIYKDVEVDPVYDDVVKVIGVSKTEFDGEGGKAEFVVKSNLTYTLSSDKDWVVVPSTRAEALPQNEAIVFEVKPYEIDYEGVSRTATITITSTDGSVSDKVEILQRPPSASSGTSTVPVLVSVTNFFPVSSVPVTSPVEVSIKSSAA